VLEFRHEPQRRLPSAPLAAGSLIAGWGAVAASGSRPLGGVVLLAGGLGCAKLWLDRHGPRTATELAGTMLGAFVLSHVLALAIGAWPSVLVCAALMGGVAYVRADAAAPQALEPKRS
jgi:CHASE2 domain-containing sensor protein